MQTLREEAFYKRLHGAQNALYTLTNRKGMAASFINYGLRLVSLMVPDTDGNFEDVVLGYPTLDDYLSQPDWYFGATVGRYANRIANGTYTLNGSVHLLTQNDGLHQLHGGAGGFHQKMWHITQTAENQIQATLFSPAGDEGFSGNLTVTAHILLTEANELRINYRATTDAPTWVNITNHSYFNLAGEGRGNVLSHYLQLNAGQYTPCNDQGIPTGYIAEVEGTPLNFLKPQQLAKVFRVADPSLNRHRGLDHNFVVRFTSKEPEMRCVAHLFLADDARRLKVFSNQPGVQVFTAGKMDGTLIGKSGRPYHASAGICIEPQIFPDTPNRPYFPGQPLEPGGKYEHTLFYSFA